MDEEALVTSKIERLKSAVNLADEENSQISKLKLTAEKQLKIRLHEAKTLDDQIKDSISATEGLLTQLSELYHTGSGKLDDSGDTTLVSGTVHSELFSQQEILEFKEEEARFEGALGQFTERQCHQVEVTSSKHSMSEKENFETSLMDKERKDEMARLQRCSKLSLLEEISENMEQAKLEAQIRWLEEQLVSSASDFQLTSPDPEQVKTEQTHVAHLLHQRLPQLIEERTRLDKVAFIKEDCVRKVANQEALLEKERQLGHLLIQQRSWHELILMLIDLEERYHLKVIRLLETLQREADKLRQTCTQFTLKTESCQLGKEELNIENLLSRALNLAQEGDIPVDAQRTLRQQRTDLDNLRRRGDETTRKKRTEEADLEVALKKSHDVVYELLGGLYSSTEPKDLTEDAFLPKDGVCSVDLTCGDVVQQLRQSRTAIDQVKEEIVRLAEQIAECGLTSESTSAQSSVRL